MAINFAYNNGMVTGDNGFTFDANKYLAGRNAAEQEFYQRNPQALVQQLYESYDKFTNPTTYQGYQNPQGIIGGVRNDLSAAGMALQPQLTQLASDYKPPTTQQNAMSAPVPSSTPSTAAPAAPTNPWQAQPKPANEMSGRGSTLGQITGGTQQTAAATTLPQETAGLTGDARAGRAAAEAAATNQTGPRFGGSPTPNTSALDISTGNPADPRAARAAAEANALAQGGANAGYRGEQLPAIQGGVGAGPINGGVGNPMAGDSGTAGTNYPGGRGNYAGYGPNAGGLRLDPSYMPENWNYQESPEYLWRMQQAEKGLNRQLLAMGRSDSTGGINAMANLRSNIAAEEVDKQYQRAVNANMANYGRYFGANQANYGRTVGEDQTGWNRAAYLGEQDWNRNWQLANLGYGATQTGVNSGNSTALALANLLSGNGANQASLALQSGAVSADQIQGLLNSGWTYQQIEAIFKKPNTQTPTPLNLPDPNNDPTYGTGYGGPDWIGFV